MEIQSSESHDLVTRIREGDREAFEAMAEMYYERLVRYAYRYVRDTGAAEDIVQDTLVRVWIGRQSLFIQHSIASYLFGAVRNRAFNYTRHLKVEARWESHLALDTMAAEDRTEAETLFEAYMVVVRKTVAALPERQAETFSLRVEHGMSFAEIAEVMGVSLRTAETNYFRAVQFLRKRLEPYFEP